jgi:hypothetical protein
MDSNSGSNDDCFYPSFLGKILWKEKGEYHDHFFTTSIGNAMRTNEETHHIPLPPPQKRKLLSINSILSVKAGNPPQYLLSINGLPGHKDGSNL